MPPMQPHESDRNPATRRRDLLVAAACGAFVAGMVGMSYAAVPLYDWFCRATGLNGTTQVATAGPSGVLDRMINVRFDANVGPGLPWKFVPERTSVTVKIGEVITVNYIAINETARETVGTAAYNVTPLTVGAYFQKINCFCFDEQRLKPGEKREMPVVFYVDPAIAKDADADGLDTITLSYTFYPSREPQRPVAEDKKLKTSGRL
jgi:cytochrome c oxidase assembly protein subunit 11